MTGWQKGLAPILHEMIENKIVKIGEKNYKIMALAWY